MSDQEIRYDKLVHDALRGVIKAVLTQVTKTGLPGEHHFFVVFDTHAEGVGISKRLLEQYPEEMTIVLQHQFWDLIVREEGFEVKLSFHSIPERLVVPYSAIKAFVDPSVPYGFQLASGEEILQDKPLGIMVPNTAPEKSGEFSLTETADGLEQAELAGDNEAQAELSLEPQQPAGGEQAAEPEEKDREGNGAVIVELDAFRRKS